ncbi:ABC transporter substrate-binding protein [Paenibacillus lutrae]|uniref:Extracellular solute-binding protein n=1 Tax=Paenibacillus lutrae TaxID=2078573 RepID=A0A7X3FFE3_9BACL|nr:extracellular solute-binding protein [Paenibacillus lutrae]MVO98426.1 extracellular solute-binding protein [Paenibacillus lutrae]
MTTKLTRLAIILLLCIVTAAGCAPFAKQTAIQEGQEVNYNTNAPTEKPAENIELTLWSHYNGFEAAIAKFQALNPNVKINTKLFTYAEYVSAYLQAIADGTPPDIMMVDSGDFGHFTAIEGLENLLDAPYQAGKYAKEFSPALWDSAMGADGKSLISFPLATGPTVTYYRADILEKHGFPSEPEELAVYMEDPANWLNMARKLRGSGIYITQWDNETLLLFEKTMGTFDRKLNFIRSNQIFYKAVSIAKTVNDDGLEAHLDIWTDAGVKAIRDGNLAMMYLGTWGADQIKSWAPETEGKWRETRLPFGLYGWQNSSNFVLPSAGKNKEMAWKFIEFAVTEQSKEGLFGAVPAYLPARGNAKELAVTNPFLGGQKAYALHEKMMAKVQEFPITPLDYKAQEVWQRGIIEGIERKKDTQKIVEDARAEVEKAVQRDKEILLGNFKN